MADCRSKPSSAFGLLAGFLGADRLVLATILEERRCASESGGMQRVTWSAVTAVMLSNTSAARAIVVCWRQGGFFFFQLG